jgi:hypothetical protein
MNASDDRRVAVQRARAGPPVSVRLMPVAVEAEVDEFLVGSATTPRGR